MHGSNACAADENSANLIPAEDFSPVRTLAAQSKRKQNDEDPPMHAPQRQRINASPSKSYPLINRLPASGSISDILLFYRKKGSRLSKSPSRWTNHHLELLECSFKSHSLPSKRAVGEPTKQALRRAIQLLREPGIASFKNCVVDELLEHYNAQRERPSLCLHFRKIPAYSLYAEALYCRPTSDSGQNSPILAYVRLETLQRLKRTSDDAKAETHPYIMAILIALAQAKCKRDRESQQSAAEIDQAENLKNGRHEQTVTKTEVYLLALSASDSDQKSCFFLYAASIPSTTLYKLDHPEEFVLGEPTHVAYYRLPIKLSNEEVENIATAFSLVFLS